MLSRLCFARTPQKQRGQFAEARHARTYALREQKSSDLKFATQEGKLTDQAIKPRRLDLSTTHTCKQEFPEEMKRTAP
jgi:hypothetical protein